MTSMIKQLQKANIRKQRRENELELRETFSFDMSIVFEKMMEVKSFQSLKIFTSHRKFIKQQVRTATILSTSSRKVLMKSKRIIARLNLITFPRG